ncbi:MAG TPA: hypothetical protein VD948_12780 [Rhodothermales bacterium]|nr:hypothetical protein [Rhodothermales bacterium]
MSVQINIAAIAPALRQMNDEGFPKQFEEDTQTFNLFGESDAPFTNGKGFRIPSNLRPSTGYGGVSEGGSFNQPNAMVNDDMYVYTFQAAQAFELSGRTIRNVESETAIIDGVTGIIENVSDTFRKELNYDVLGDGSGLRAIYKSGTTTLTLYNSTGHTPTSGFGSTKGAVRLKVGGWYDVYDSTLATFRGSFQVTSKTNTTAVINAAVSGITDTDVIVPQNSLLKLPRGLAYIVNNDTGVFQLLSRSTYPELKSPVTDLNGAAISVSDFSKTKRLLLARSGIGKAKKLAAILSLAQDDALCRLGQTYKRWEGNAKTFDGSFDAFAHGDTVFKVDPDVDEDRIYLVAPMLIKRYKEMDFGLYDYDGNELRMKSGTGGYGSDAYTGAVGFSGNWGTPEPRCHALIKRCSVTGLATQVASQA